MTVANNNTPSPLTIMNAETAEELRKMVRGDEPYKCFTYTPSKIKNIWLTAADLIEGNMAQLID